jgi:hypothetical protein
VYVDENSDIAISSFLRNSSLVFAAIFAHYARYSFGVFNESRIDVRSLLGILIFIFGIISFLGFPSFVVLKDSFVSFWIIGSLLIGFNRAITELLMQTFTKSISRIQMNLGIGLGLIMTGTIGLLLFKPVLIYEPMLVFNIFCVAFIIPLMQAFRFSAFRYLNEVLGKKGYTIWAYLFFSMILAAWIFSENLSWYKWLGLLIGALAVAMLDKGTYKAVFKRT